MNDWGKENVGEETNIFLYQLFCWFFSLKFSHSPQNEYTESERSQQMQIERF